MNFLVTFDENYIAPFKVLLHSFYVNNPGETESTFYLVHSAIGQEALTDLGEYCKARDVALVPVQVEKALFKEAPSSKRYPLEMYYRLLAPHILPQTLERVIYLDPDMLIINSLRPLWTLDFCGNAFAAAAHTGITEITNDLNRVRLGTSHDYYNSGVIGMDLARAREVVQVDEMFQKVKKYQHELILPDQDVFNALYGSQTLPIDDAVWNYDARNYSNYLLRSGGVRDMDWIMENTAILHFCGAKKPWKTAYAYRFGILYKHYMRLAAR